MTYAAADKEPLRLCRKGLVGFVANENYLFVPYKKNGGQEGILLWQVAGDERVYYMHLYPRSVAKDYESGKKYMTSGPLPLSEQLALLKEALKQKVICEI